MADITVSQNDKGFYLLFTVKDSAGNAYNLAGYTIKLKVWLPRNPNKLIVNGSCEIVNGTNGTCKYSVAATDFTAVNIYNAELELTKTGIIESTETFTIEVKESG